MKKIGEKLLAFVLGILIGHLIKLFFPMWVLFIAGIFVVAYFLHLFSEMIKLKFIKAKEA